MTTLNTEYHYRQLDEADARLQMERRFDLGPDYCPYCSTHHQDPHGGWYGVDPDDLEGNDKPIHVAEWDGWYIPCESCNPDGEQWPDGLTITLGE